MKRIITVLFCTLSFFIVFSQTVITSATSGNWSTGATWVGGVVPGASNKVVIASSHTVTFNATSATVTGLVISDGAIFKFEPNSSQTLVVNNKNIEVYGKWELKPSSQSVIHKVQITGITETNFVGSGMNILASDVGIWVMGGNMGDPGTGGQLDWLGSTKTSFLNTTAGLTAGATTLTLASVPVGWAVGDSIVLTPTEDYNVVGDPAIINFEERVISAISGATITLNAALTRAHPMVNSRWTTEVINLSRNVRVEGTPTGRTHVFIRSAKTQSIKFAQFKYMGPRKDRGGSSATELISGRYFIHFHHCHDQSKGSVVEGNVAKFGGNHVYVPHQSDSILFKDNAAYSVDEIAYWWDPGEQSNSTTWDHNIAAKLSYVPGSLNMNAEDAPTFTGGGFLFSRGDDNVANNNIAVGTIAASTRDGGAFHWEATIIEGVWGFNHNLAHNNVTGLRVWQNSTRNHVIDNYDAYNNIVAIDHGAYANSYTYRGGTLYNNPFEVEASSGTTAKVRIEDMTFNGAGIQPYGARVVSSPIPAPYPTWFRNCTFSNFITAGIIDAAPNELKNVDIVQCNAINGTLYAFAPEATSDETIRVQPTSGQTVSVTKAGSTNISRFAATQWGTGTGLKEDMYNSINFTNYAWTRTASIIAYEEWSLGVHHKITDSTNMSIRWTGEIQPQFTESYTFTLGSAGGHRLWVNNVLILDQWTEHYPAGFTSSPISLIAGQKYAIKLEYFNDDERNGMLLFWQSASTELELVPQTQLYLPEEEPSGNLPPTANAGSTQTITNPPTSSVTLNGSMSADADGTITNYLWERVSGPNTPTIVSPTTVSTSVTGLVVGTYVFRLTVTDNNDATAQATVTINVNYPPNVAPTANAGSDQTVTVNYADVSGSGSADSDGTIVAYSWSKKSGPVAYTIVNSNSSNASFRSLQSGVYVFTLKVTDNNGAESTDDITITANIANILPTANAGVDKAIALPTSTVTVTGSGGDADGGIVSYLWTKKSGPVTYNIVSSSSASTVINGLTTAGTYEFTLTVTDNSGGEGSDDVVVVVSADTNTPPTANAGTDISITLPVNSVVLNGSLSSDTEGAITYAWSKLSGPSYTINNATIAQPTISLLTAGTYVFRLTVVDSGGLSATDNVTISVSSGVTQPPNSIRIFGRAIIQ